MRATLGQLLDERARLSPAADAVTGADRALRYGYRRFKEGCDRIARGLLRAGARSGDSVVVLSGNRPETIVLCWALLEIGAVLAFARREGLESVLRGCRAHGLIMEGGVSSFLPELAHYPAGQIQCERFPDLRYVVNLASERRPGSFRFADLVDLAELVPREELRGRERAVEPGQLALVALPSQASAGWTHADLLYAAGALLASESVTPNDRILLARPFADPLGLVAGAAAVLAGAALIPLAEEKNPAELAETARRTGATVLVARRAALERARDGELGGLRAILALADGSLPRRSLPPDAPLPALQLAPATGTSSRSKTS